MTELLNCPFCASALVRSEDRGFPWWEHPGDVPCIMNAFMGQIDDPDDIAAWNTRTATIPDPAQIRADAIREAAVACMRNAMKAKREGRGDFIAHEIDADAILALLDQSAPAGHSSDCAMHNEPAYPAGPCDCGAAPAGPTAAQLLQHALALPEVAELVGAATALKQAVCGPTGFAEAVRHNSGRAYPWPSLDAAETRIDASLAKLKGGA